MDSTEKHDFDFPFQRGHEVWCSSSPAGGAVAAGSEVGVYMCVQFSVMLCMRDHTRVCLQLCEVPAAASGADEGSSSLESCVCECVFSFRRPMQIWVWSAAGVSHSLGRQLCRNGIQELKYANRFTQRGISLPHSNYGERERENKMM